MPPSECPAKTTRRPSRCDSTSDERLSAALAIDVHGASVKERVSQGCEAATRSRIGSSTGPAAMTPCTNTTKAPRLSLRGSCRNGRVAIRHPWRAIASSSWSLVTADSGRSVAPLRTARPRERWAQKTGARVCLPVSRRSLKHI